MAQEDRVTIHDVRAAKHCCGGARSWFHHYDLDWHAFLRDGIDIDTFLATGDPLAEDIVKRKRERG